MPPVLALVLSVGNFLSGQVSEELLSHYLDILSIAKFSIKQTVDNKPVTNTCTLKVICNITVNPPVVRLVHCGTG